MGILNPLALAAPLVALALAAAPTARAAPVTLGTGESAVFSFDLTGATPSPPFASQILYYQSSGSGSGTVEWFTELFAVGFVFSSLVTETLESSGVAAGGDQDGFVDGKFSVRITIDSGSLIFDPYARGANRTGELTASYAPLPAISVAEPSTLALLALALAGAGFARRRTGAPRHRSTA